MRIKHVSIENFRSIAELECDFDTVTTFVGPNGAGKSNVLRALDWFFNGDKGALAVDDVHQGAGEGARIRVRVDFDGLTDDDRAALGPRYCLDESISSFTVWRTWQGGEEKITAKALAFGPFEDIRKFPSAGEKRSAYTALRSEHPEYQLPSWTSATAAEQAMTDWELDHPRDLADAEVSDTHFFGFNSRGKLSELFDFVFVSADLRAADEVGPARDSILSRILQRAVDRTVFEQATADLVARYAAELAGLSEQHIGDQIRGLESDLSSEVATYAKGREVRLRDSPISLKPGASGVQLHIAHSAVETPIALQGHGFQRTLLLAALTVLSKRARHAAGQMFLAIEEPELFQHPTQAKAFASVLRHLAEDAGQRTQVAYATHSPYFVDPRYFDQVRRVTAMIDAPGSCASSRIFVASIEKVEQRLDGFVPLKSLKNRWDQVCLKYLPEALFAHNVILVEGDEDAAVLQGLGTGLNELAVQGVCVASVCGKSNMTIPYAVLELLGIPALMVVDNDSGAGDRMHKNAKSEAQIAEAEGKIRKDNRSLCRFVGEPEEDYPVGAVGPTLAFVPDTMESLLASDIPAWDLTRQKVIEEGRGVEGKNAATYEIASRECGDEPGADLKALLDLCTGGLTQIAS